VSGVHAHQVLPDRSGRWVVGVDLGTDSVDVYRLVDGALARHQRLAAGPGPRHLVWHGDRAYVLCENAPRVLACSWDADAGQLSVLDAYETAGPGNFPAEILLSSDGRFLHVTNRGDNTIATFAVGDPLVRLPDVPSGGDWPRHAVLDPTGRWLYVSNQRSGTVTWLPRDPDTGVLSPPVGQTKVADVAMVLFA
jgi:6-phosphogluconolactonase (cycloisomerase 2 family)